MSKSKEAGSKLKYAADQLAQAARSPEWKQAQTYIQRAAQALREAGDQLERPD